MSTGQVTFEWLVPVLIGSLVGMIGIIGWMIRGYLSIITKDFSDLKNEIKSSNEEMRKYFKENEDRHHVSDIRITKLEEHSSAG